MPRVNTPANRTALRTMLAVLLASAIASSGFAQAERAPASHRFVGDVVDVACEVVPTPGGAFGNTDVRFESRVRVTGVEHGDGIGVGDSVVVRSWLPNTIGLNESRIGQRVVPAVGERVRVEATRGPDGYDAACPDGFASVAGGAIAEFGPAAWYRRTGHLTTVGGVPILGIVLGVAAFVGMMILDRARGRKRNRG